MKMQKILAAYTLISLGLGASSIANAYQCNGMPKVKCDKISYCAWVPKKLGKDGMMIKGYCQVKKSRPSTTQKPDMKKPKEGGIKKETKS